MCQIIFVSYFCFGICMPHTAASGFSCISCMARAFAIASNHWNIPHATSFYVIVIGTVRLFRVAQCFAARTTDVIFSFFSCSSRAFAIASNHWNMIDSPPKNSRSRFFRNIFCADGLFCAGFCQTHLRRGSEVRIPDFSSERFHTTLPYAASGFLSFSLAISYTFSAWHATPKNHKYNQFMHRVIVHVT